VPGIFEGAVMKILIAIPHFWKPSAVEGAGSGSTGPDPEPRVKALAACLNALRQNFGPQQYLCGNAGIGEQANAPHVHEIDVVICTHGANHLRGSVLEFPHEHCMVGGKLDPMCLGFVCQRELLSRLGNYDYYCMMEDDLIIRDPWFFEKLRWFDGESDVPGAILQPRRYESGHGSVGKLYIDGALSFEQTRAFQDVSHSPKMVGWDGFPPATFERCLNPHAGCFFLTREQMQTWADTDYFKADMQALKRGERPDCSFIGPLESGATLGVMRTFRIYKPSPECANFFEIEHYGTKYLDEFVRNQKPA
jgi:hypothetical protein